jgi:hypothetical protein
LLIRFHPIGREWVPGSRSTLRAAPRPEFSKIKFGRLGTVEDLAGTVVFLGRDPSSRQGGRIGRHWFEPPWSAASSG